MVRRSGVAEFTNRAIEIRCNSSHPDGARFDEIANRRLARLGAPADANQAQPLATNRSAWQPRTQGAQPLVRSEHHFLGFLPGLPCSRLHCGQYQDPFTALSRPTQAKWNQSPLHLGASHLIISPCDTFSQGNKSE
eukprot:m.85514 g.85514  ORF g.85514 m.85514 type:complete len:136 (-) comp50878_c0_seq13:618-1025(-)